MPIGELNASFLIANSYDYFCKQFNSNLYNDVIHLFIPIPVRSIFLSTTEFGLFFCASVQSEKYQHLIIASRPTHTEKRNNMLVLKHLHGGGNPCGQLTRVTQMFMFPKPTYEHVIFRFLLKSNIFHCLHTDSPHFSIDPVQK